MHWRLPNSARNLAEAEFGRTWEKWPNFGFAEAEAEIRCNPTMDGLYKLTNALSNGTIYDILRPPLQKIGGLQLSYPLLSQDQVKLRTSNLAGIFTGPIRIKAH